MNILQLAGTILLWQLDVRRKKEAARKARSALYQSLSTDEQDEVFEDEHEPIPSGGDPERLSHSQPAIDASLEPDRQPLLPPPPATAATTYIESTPPRLRWHEQKGMARSEAEKKRGKAFTVAAGGFLVFAWVFYMVTMWVNLRSKKDKN